MSQYKNVFKYVSTKTKKKYPKYTYNVLLALVIQKTKSDLLAFISCTSLLCRLHFGSFGPDIKTKRVKRKAHIFLCLSKMVQFWFSKKVLLHQTRFLFFGDFRSRKIIWFLILRFLRIFAYFNTFGSGYGFRGRG